MLGNTLSDVARRPMQAGSSRKTWSKRVATNPFHHDIAKWLPSLILSRLMDTARKCREPRMAVYGDLFKQAVIRASNDVVSKTIA
jgi:hypothetical protein